MPRINQAELYSKSIEKHGNTPQGVFWKSQSSQYKRFKVISKILENIEFDSIVDAGSGFGDLYLYLKEHMEFEHKLYIGIDNNPNMVEISAMQTKQAIFCKDVLYDMDMPTADFYIASGSMNFLNRTETYFFISKMLLFSNKGIIFNILEKNQYEKTDKSDIYNRFTMDEILYLLKPFNLKIKVIRGYLRNDLTIFAQKQ